MQCDHCYGRSIQSSVIHDGINSRQRNLGMQSNNTLMSCGVQTVEAA